MTIVSGEAARSSAARAGVPVARVPIHIRVATMADLPFLDALQKKNSRALGYFPTKQFEGYIGMGAVLVAEDRDVERKRKRDEVEEAPPRTSSLRHSVSPSLPLGYIISRDRYLKRDELGIIYQLCVDHSSQRKLIGAALVKEVFARSAYGCRLYCCWCAQDLAANRFWESMGFAAVAFRAGSSGKKRVHIFWQRRVCDGDTETKWWYPSQTNSGAIREDRLVFPIPPGTHWSEVRAVAMPGMERPKLECPQRKQVREPKSKVKSALVPPPGKVGIVVGGRIKYVDRPGYVATEAERAIELRSKAKPNPAPREPRAKVKIDPKYVAAARELRDRYLEQVNADAPALPVGKYDVSRALEAPSVNPPAPARHATPVLPAPLAA